MWAIEVDFDKFQRQEISKKLYGNKNFDSSVLKYRLTFFTLAVKLYDKIIESLIFRKCSGRILTKWNFKYFLNQK